MVVEKRRARDRMTRITHLLSTSETASVCHTSHHTSDRIGSQRIALALQDFDVSIVTRENICLLYKVNIIVNIDKINWLPSISQYN